MPFDIQAAEKAGYSKDEIVGYLAKEKNFDVEAAKKAGYKDEEIISHLSTAQKPAGPSPDEPNFKQKFVDTLMSGLKAGGPLGLMTSVVGSGLKAGGERLDKAAYDVGGKTSELAAQVGVPAEVAGGLGVAANVATQALPAVVGGRIAQTAAPAVEGTARWLMGTALKPTPNQWLSGKADRAITKLLDEGFNATNGGVRTLKTKIEDFTREVADKIRNSTEVVDKQAVWGPVKEALDKFTRQATPNASIAKIREAWDEFLNHPLASGNTIPVQIAEEIKQGTYRALKGKYGQTVADDAGTAAQKAIARGLRGEIERVAPEVAPINKEISELINALDVTERRALMDLNKNPGSLALLAHSKGAALGFMADKSALFKSLVARLLHSGRERLPQAVGSGAVVAGEQIHQQE